MNELPPRHFPTCSAPAELPALRRWLLRAWDPAGSIHRIDRWVHHTLRAAVLWWVEPETCDVLAACAPTWPAGATLDFTEVRVLSGLAEFAQDLEGTDADPRSPAGHTVRVSGLLWGPITLPPLPGGEPREGIGIAAWSRFPVGDGLTPDDLQRAAPNLAALTEGPGAGWRTLTGELFAHIGRADWIAGMGPDDPIPDAPMGQDLQTLASMSEDRRLIASLWKLAETPSITATTVVTPPRQQARAQRRAGHDPAVRVLSLGGQRTDTHTSRRRPSSRGRYHSWIVRPFWRWQAYGPGHSLRRLILIASHRRGDPSLPLLGAERVWRVKPPPGRQ